AQFRRRKSARLRPGAGHPSEAMPGAAALANPARPEPVPRTVAAARRIAARGRQRLQRDRSMKRR
ncbi:MAG: hypothetical protein ACM36B_01355, partial [Bacteroidota bacterium]